MDAIDLLIKATDLFIAGTVSAEQWQQVRQDLAQMKAENRDPTKAEFDVLFASIEADTAAIEAADKRLNP